jgi:hypothetical protein
MWIRVTSQSEADRWVSLTEIDHTNFIEAGLFNPEPGHEQHERLEENRSRLAQLGITAS